MSDWLKKYREAERNANAVSWYLRELSELCHEYGNYKIALRLEKMHVDLTKSLEKMNEAISESIDEDLKRAQQGTANMIKACLAMGKLKEEKV